MVLARRHSVVTSRRRECSDAMSGAYSMHQRYEKCIQNFDYRTGRNGKGNLVGLGVAGITVLRLIIREGASLRTSCCCGHGDELWPFINCMELLEYLSNKQLLTKDLVGTDSVWPGASCYVSAVHLRCPFFWDIASRHVYGHSILEDGGMSLLRNVRHQRYIPAERRIATSV
jgi:hypothetical protein